MDLLAAMKLPRDLSLFEFNVLAQTAEDEVFEDGAVKVEQVKLDMTANKKCPN
jgi:hypothetical protein